MLREATVASVRDAKFSSLILDEDIFLMKRGSIRREDEKSEVSETTRALFYVYVKPVKLLIVIVVAMVIDSN